MSKIKRIQEMPDLSWLEHTKFEIDMTGPQLVHESDFVYQIGDAAVIGFIYTSLLADPWMWFALTDSVRIGDLMDFRRLARFIPPRTYTGVRQDYIIGRKFAEAYGFAPMGKVMEVHNLPYEIYRRP